MKPTTQRKVAVGVLVLAAGVLLLDRAFLAPSGVVAAPPDPAPAAQTLEVVTGAPATKSEPSGSQKLASRLAIAADSQKWTAEQAVGALRSTPPWVNGPQSGSASGQTPAAAFAAEHVLKAVLETRGNQGERIALVNGKPMKVGAQLDGFTLIKVEARSATFEAGTSRVILKLPRLPGEGDPIAHTPGR